MNTVKEQWKWIYNTEWEIEDRTWKTETITSRCPKITHFSYLAARAFANNEKRGEVTNDEIPVVKDFEEGLIG